MEILRPELVKRLDDKRGNALVKIVTGVRRCGKSFLLFTLFRKHLLSIGVPADHIVCLALDDYANRKFLNPDDLYGFIRQMINDEGHYFVLLDEIQLVKGFEQVLNGFLHMPNVDVYVTGSNSRFLSSDIVTEFRGRGDEIRVLPFSFAEMHYATGGDKRDNWAMYQRYGGMPQLIHSKSDAERDSYLKSLFEQVYFSDIVNRYNLRGEEILESLVDVLASSVGSLVNPKRIANTFETLSKLKVAESTLAKYLLYMQDAFIISKAMRYDVKGRQYISTPSKYYFVDHGLRNARLNFRQQDPGHIMENVIYVELLRRGYSVDVGSVSSSLTANDGVVKRVSFEVDFVANKGDKRLYIQSAQQILTAEKRLQECQSLRLIKDSFKKIVIEDADFVAGYDQDGIYHLPLLDFLLSPDSLDKI